MVKKIFLERPAEPPCRMTDVSFTLCGVDVTNPVLAAAVWWTCSDCGVDVELPAGETAGYLLSCPDCPGSLHEMWCWEQIAA
jgi:hypothetical protein